MNGLGHAPVDPALVERFRGDVARKLGHSLLPDEQIALAVSGGPDSMAMLLLAAAAFPGCLIAATVDHRLRPEAVDEAAMVARWCAAAGVPHATLVVDTAIGPTAIHERARHLRYDLLARWALDANAACVATAHHADDQAETFLMRAARGSGPAGLAGIRPCRALKVTDGHPGYPVGGVVAVGDWWTVPLIRPLLDWRSAELRALATAAAVPFVDDPSNADDRFERSRVRKMLAEQPWLDAAQLAKAAAHAGEAHAALEAMESWLWRTRKAVPPDAVDSDYQQWLDFADLPRELRRRLARSAIADVKLVNGIMPDFDRATNIEPLLDAVEQGRAATQAGVLVSRSGDIWHFRGAPPRRSL